MSLWRAKFFNTAEADGFTGRPGELTYDVNRKRASLHDGTTQGGLGVGGFVIPIGGDVSFNPVLGTTYFIGNQFATATDATNTNVWIPVPRGGKIRQVYWQVHVAGTLAPADGVTMGIDIHTQGGGGAIASLSDATLTWEAVNNTYIQSASPTLAPIPANGWIVGKIVTPGWAQNPTTVRIRGLVYID